MLLNFFGVIVELSVECPEDEYDAHFFYGPHCISTGTPELKVTLKCHPWPERGFFTSLLRKDGLLKSMQIEPIGGDPTSHEFSHWSGVASPLPPFRDSQLWQRVGSQSGACVLHPDGRGILLMGQNYVGKTATMLELCGKRGYRLVSDSLIVVDPASRKALSYASPLGFRRQNLQSYLPVLRQVPTRDTVNPSTGIVVLARPEHILAKSLSPTANLDSIILLHRSDDGPTISTVPTPCLKWYSGIRANEFAECLPQTMTVLRLPVTASPEVVTDLLEECLL
jgi:hypothetical protein